MVNAPNQPWQLVSVRTESQAEDCRAEAVETILPVIQHSMPWWRPFECLIARYAIGLALLHPREMTWAEAFVRATQYVANDLRFTDVLAALGEDIERLAELMASDWVSTWPRQAGIVLGHGIIYHTHLLIEAARRNPLLPETLRELLPSEVPG